MEDLLSIVYTFWGWISVRAPPLEIVLPTQCIYGDIQGTGCHIVHSAFKRAHVSWYLLDEQSGSHRWRRIIPHFLFSFSSCKKSFRSHNYCIKVPAVSICDIIMRFLPFNPNLKKIVSTAAQLAFLESSDSNWTLGMIKLLICAPFCILLSSWKHAVDL